MMFGRRLRLCLLCRRGSTVKEKKTAIYRNTGFNRKSEGESSRCTPTWQFGQSSNRRRLHFPTILWWYLHWKPSVMLEWIIQIRCSCVCCLKEHFLFLLNHQYTRAKKTKKSPYVSPCERKLLLPWEQRWTIPPLAADSVHKSNILFAWKMKLQMFRT